MRIPYGFILASDGVLNINKDVADVISMSKPIGVSAYQITSSLPEELERQLPSVEDIQKRIKGVKE